MKPYVFLPGNSYRIQEVIGDRKSPLVGLLLTLTELGPESAFLPHSAIICKGTVNGKPHEFPAGVRLAAPFTSCYCSRWPFPHRRGATCHPDQAA